MDREFLSHLDGPALTLLAWELGLAPQHWTPIDKPWRPHEDLAQADAVFRGLRAHGWNTAVEWYAPGAFGDISASHGSHMIKITWGSGEDETSEPLALLRCAVLARASEEETTHAPTQNN